MTPEELIAESIDYKNEKFIVTKTIIETNKETYRIFKLEVQAYNLGLLGMPKRTIRNV